MVNVTESYKLLETEVDGALKVLKVNTSEAWNVFEFDFEGKKGTVNEGDEIRFLTEAGELKTGILTKIIGKKEKTKLQIVPTGMEYEEIWSVLSIKEGTLQVIVRENTKEDGDGIDEE